MGQQVCLAGVTPPFFATPTNSFYDEYYFNDNYMPVSQDQYLIDQRGIPDQYRVCMATDMIQPPNLHHPQTMHPVLNDMSNYQRPPAPSCTPHNSASTLGDGMTLEMQTAYEEYMQIVEKKTRQSKEDWAACKRDNSRCSDYIRQTHTQSKHVNGADMVEEEAYALWLKDQCEGQQHAHEQLTANNNDPDGSNGVGSNKHRRPELFCGEGGQKLKLCDPAVVGVYSAPQAESSPRFAASVVYGIK